MSEVQRYQPNFVGGMQKALDGQYVLAADYDALEAECERLRERVADERRKNNSQYGMTMKARKERNALADKIFAIKAQEPTAWARRVDLDNPEDCLFVSRYFYPQTGYAIPLYTAPPPQPSTVALVEALKRLRQDAYDACADSSCNEAFAIADAALAAHAQELQP